METNINEKNPVPLQPDTESDQDVTNEELLRRLIRLVVGMALIGQDALRRELPAWEAEAARRLAEIEETETDPARAILDPTGPWFPKRWEYRLVGLAFASPKYLQSAFSTIMRAPKSIWRITAPLRLPLDMLGISDLSRDWLENAVDKIYADLDQLEQVGKEEAIPSRGLAYIAVLKTYEMVIHSLAQNQEVQELIQQQSVGLTTEMVEEVRERAVGLDIATDAIMRRLLGLKSTSPSPHSPNQPPDIDKRDPSW